MVLVDDHTLFREGLARVLGSYGGLEVVGETTNDQAAIELVRERKPDVVVMQVQVPFERAKESLFRMREASPPPKIVICTMFEDPAYLQAFLSMGADAYVTKSLSAEELTGAIRAAVFDPEGENVVLGMPREMIEEAKKGSEGVLSAREMEIVVLVSRGLSNRQIASSTNLAEATVKRHLANIYPKIGVNSRGEAVREALSKGWITIQEAAR